jgi:outer membrane protein assembly factor BamB
MKTLVTFFVLITACSAIATDWPQWRGPQRNGISDEKAWTAHWPASGLKTLWTANVGIGFSAFSVADGRVFTTGNESNTDTVFCFDAASGKLNWKQSYPADLGDKYFEGGTAATPTIDGSRVYQLSRWGDVFCYEAASGKVVWSKNVQKETGFRIPDWGYSGSPLVQGSLLLLNVGSAGVALNKADGKIVWKSSDNDAGYSTPLPFKRGGESLALIATGKTFVAVNVQSGAKIWEFPWPTRFGVNAADPIVSGDYVFISAGYNRGSALVKFGETTPVWQNRELRNQFNSSILIDGHLYGIDNDNNTRASLKCMEIKSGAVKWTDQGVGFGSLMAADGKLIVLSAKGELITAKPTPEKFDVISRAQVLKGKCWTVPVLANGRIYCRNAAGDVVCLDVHK